MFEKTQKVRSKVKTGMVGNRIRTSLEDILDAEEGETRVKRGKVGWKKEKGTNVFFGT